MKRTILLTLTITLSSVALFAQTKIDSAFTLKASKGSKITSWTSTISTTSTPILDSVLYSRISIPSGYSYPTFNIVAGQQKTVMKLKVLKDGQQTALSDNWDTMVISINKKQIHWLNDSTAVYIKN